MKGSDHNKVEPSFNIMNNSDVLFEKFLKRPMKERTSTPDVKDQDEKKIPSAEFYFAPPVAQSSNGVDKKWNLDFSMWHSVGSVNAALKNSEEEETVLRTHSQQHLGGKVEMVYNLLSITTDKEEMAKTFLAMSSSPESCSAVRQSGCLPLLVQLIHGTDESKSVRRTASQALRNIVHYHADDKQGRREMRALKLIEYLMEYCEDDEEDADDPSSVSHSTQNKLRENHPGAIIATLMKLSFDEEHRHAMCQLGALQVIAKLIQKDHARHSGVDINDIKQDCITLRRYAGMSLTNLTFGDGKNKSLLCSLKPFMIALIAQLNSSNEELCQVTASVLRNLSWRADTVSKQSLRELGAVTSLMKTALKVKNESTLKAILSALWNFSAHCNLNKIDICNVDGAIEYLVKMLTYQAPSKSLLIVENAGGILRNISSIIAVREDYRYILRRNNCLEILTHQLESPSLTVVSNACGTLWNLSARNITDQRTLWNLGAVRMLRSLTHSKHKMISIGSSASLKNLLSSRPDCELFDKNNKGLPTLLVRKRRALEQELDISLSETCDNIDQIESWDSFNLSVNSICTSNNASSNLDNTQSASCRNLNVFDETLNINETVGNITKMENSESEESNKEKFDHMKKSDSSTDDKGLISCSDKIDADTCSEILDDLQISADNNQFVCDSNINQNMKEDGYCKMEELYNEEESYGNYAETDLDEPTNYSLKYVEQDVQTYSTEGTPYNFLSSNSILHLHQTSKESAERISSPAVINTAVPPKEDAIKEVKNVTFDTPLMFSRSSSLGSLSSCEQHDDRSSVISEFSRLASGAISPSELPDSPTQTIPSTPHPPVKISSQSKPKEEHDIFEDSVKVFKDESTPLHFSTTTSLSSLTFDDDSQNINMLPVVDEISSEENTVKKSDVQIQPNICYVAPMSRNARTDEVNSGVKFEQCIKDEECALDEELSLEEQQALLDACIKTAIPIKKTAATKDNTNNYTTVCSKTKPKCYSPTSSINGDFVVSFCTEGTPANISHAASNSDLSLLCPSEDSFLRDSVLPLSSCNDDVELSLEEQKNLLNECISAGLKPLNDTTPKFNDCTTEDLSTHEQKSLRKKCKMPVINNVTSTHKTVKSAASLVNVDLTEDEQTLLNQIVTVGIRNIKDISCELKNIGPPSFLAEANLENSLINVDSITSELAESPNTSVIVEVTLVEDNANNTVISNTNDITPKDRHTPKLKRRLIKDRYSTYTINTNEELQPIIHNTNMCENIKKSSDRPKKSFLIKERRADKDRFKTRTLSDGDFDELATYEIDKNSKKIEQFSKQINNNTKLLYNGDTISVSSNSDSEAHEYQTSTKAKIVKPLTVRSAQPVRSSIYAQQVKSSIPIVNKPKTPIKSSSAPGVKSKIPTKLPAPLQRQGTFTKDDSVETIPINTKSPSKAVPSKPIHEAFHSTKDESQNRITAKVDFQKNVKVRGSPSTKNDAVKNRWSISDNSINTVSSFKTSSNSNLNLTTGAYTSKNIHTSPQTSLTQPKKNVTSKIAGLWKKSKVSKSVNKP